MVAKTPWLRVDEFWDVVEACRRGSTGLTSFDEALVSHLVGWDFPRIAGFHNTLWYDVGVFHDTELWAVMREGCYSFAFGQNSWERYGGWLVAQGREFHEAVMADPWVAKTRLPDAEELASGEFVIFVAYKAASRKTKEEYEL